MADIGYRARTLDHHLEPGQTPYPRLVPAARKAVIRLDGVSKVFARRSREEVVAVADLTLTIDEASAILLTGPSGAGKTTLLSLAGCMVRPTSGRIVLDGHDITRLSEERLAELRRRRIGFVFQKHHLIRGASALHNVMLPALPLPEVDGDLRDRARALLERFGLQRHAAEGVEHLSGGEQQRVALARALINDPGIVIADEPTAHLDSAAARGFLELIDQLVAEKRTVLVASHDAVLYGSGRFDRVLRLRDGRLDNDGEAPCS